MATKSGFRSRQPDNRYKEKTVDSHRLNDKRFTMAFADRSQTAPDCKFSMTPSMLMVQPGSEYVTKHGKTLWNRSGTIPAAFKALLSHFADHLLQDAGKKGKADRHLEQLAENNGYMWFMYPHVTQSCHNIHCTQCHMPGSTGFSHFPSHKCPYHTLHDKEKHTWYTMVNLGKDSKGQVVWERAHAILAAARWGIPHAVFDTTLPDKDTPHALHHPCCPGSLGGCLNPLHIRWGLEAQNRQDQETKRSSMNRGPKAWNRKHDYALVPD